MNICHLIFFNISQQKRFGSFEISIISINSLYKYSLKEMSQASTQNTSKIIQRHQHQPIYIDPALLQQDEAVHRILEEKDQTLDIKYELRALKTIIDPKLNNVVPIMASISGSGSRRSNIDLICVLDISGSMQGEKLYLLKQTITFMLEVLDPNDRFSLITFENKACQYTNLKRIDADFKASASRIIQSLRATGGTNICSGLQLALESIKSRKSKNQVTSIFLLSDGQDQNATKNVEQLLKGYDQTADTYSIHTFGIGSDHDENIMTQICQLKNGGFYYIKEYDTLDQSFSNALGAVISVLLEKVSISLTLVPNDLSVKMRLGKCYGPFWKVKEDIFSVQFSHLISDISRDFLFEIEIPAFQSNQQKSIHVVSSLCVGLSSTKTFQWQKDLTLLIGEDNTEEDIQVLQNYVRVKAVESIGQCKNLEKTGQLQLAKTKLRELSTEIRNNPKLRPQKMLRLILDIQNIIERCNQMDHLTTTTRKVFTSSLMTLSNQSPNIQYSTPMQTETFSRIRSLKYSSNPLSAPAPVPVPIKEATQGLEQSRALIKLDVEMKDEKQEKEEKEEQVEKIDNAQKEDSQEQEQPQKKQKTLEKAQKFSRSNKKKAILLSKQIEKAETH